MDGSMLKVIREYWDRQPCCSRHSPAPCGTREYFDQTADRRYFVQPHIRDFADFPRWAGKRVLEIGCGIGTDAAEFIKAGAEYTGVDLSPKSLALARQRLDCLGLKGELLLGDIENLLAVLPLNIYDLVYSFGVLHHTPNPDAVVRGVRRYLGPKSEFRFMVYAENSWKATMIRAGLDQFEAQDNCPLATTWTAKAVCELLQGYAVLSIRQDHIFPYRVPEYKRFRYVLQPWFAAMPPDVFRALETSFGWHLLVRCRA